MNLDFVTVKNIAISERLQLQFRFEAFNFLKSPYFLHAEPVCGRVSAIRSSGRFPVGPIDITQIGSFNTISSTAASNRQLQFALKLIW